MMLIADEAFGEMRCREMKECHLHALEYIFEHELICLMCLTRFLFRRFNADSQKLMQHDHSSPSEPY